MVLKVGWVGLVWVMDPLPLKGKFQVGRSFPIMDCCSMRGKYGRIVS